MARSRWIFLPTEHSVGDEYLAQKILLGLDLHTLVVGWLIGEGCVTLPPFRLPKEGS